MQVPDKNQPRGIDLSEARTTGPRRNRVTGLILVLCGLGVVGVWLLGQYFKEPEDVYLLPVFRTTLPAANKKIILQYIRSGNGQVHISRLIDHDDTRVLAQSELTKGDSVRYFIAGFHYKINPTSGKGEMLENPAPVIVETGKEVPAYVIDSVKNLMHWPVYYNIN